MAPRKISIEELERWPSVKDVAEELDRSRQGIRNMLASRDLTGVHTRIGWLIDPASVRAWRLLREDERRQDAVRRARSVTDGHARVRQVRVKGRFRDARNPVYTGEHDGTG